jgi:hypothetical protein
VEITYVDPARSFFVVVVRCDGYDIGNDGAGPCVPLIERTIKTSPGELWSQSIFYEYFDKAVRVTPLPGFSFS